MLRRGLAALMLGVICAGSVTADEAARGQGSAPRSGLVGWLKSTPAAPATRKQTERGSAGRKAAGVKRAVVDDAERQSAAVRQTSGQAEDDVVVVSPAQSAPSVVPPIPLAQPPVLPNASSVSGPQYFSAVPTGGLTNPVPVYPGSNWQQYSPPVPTQQVSAGQYYPISSPGMAGPVVMGQYGPISENVPSGQYPQTGAALYPAPVPGIPQQIGGTLIPNKAFHPHEMLYAHRYRAMYPPYYYKVNGGFMVTPFGVWSHEDWRLQGTMVDVKYKSHISPFSLYKRPVVR